MIKVVIDTNIFISAILSQNGFAVEVIKKALQKEIKPQIGAKLFLEYEDVLSREDIKQKSKLSIVEIEDLLNALISVSKYSDIFYLWRPNLQDEKDNHIVELAVATNAEFIITNNIKDFDNKELNFNFKVLNAKDFIQRS